MTKILGRLMIVGLIFLTGCQYYFPPSGSPKDVGQIVITGLFPDQLGVKVVPGDTTSITVRVTGDKIPAGSVLQAELTPLNRTVTFIDVPSGKNTVKATAFDDSGNRLAEGFSDITVIAGATVAATVTMQLTTDVGKFNLVIQ